MKTNPIFQRVTTAYDLERMQHVRLIAVGCGGARSFLDDIARCGVGEFVLIDKDSVEEPNIGTQQVYLNDIGRPKVDCVADRILEINPDAMIVTCHKPLEEIDDEEFEALAFSPLQSGYEEGRRSNSRFVPQYSPHPPKRSGSARNGYPPVITLLGGFTDDFYTQARVHRLSLQFSLPSLCVQLYQFGQAGEITFTYPGVTPACQRCILSPRYKAYLERGYVNTVTSDGSPVFATSRVNSLKGMIALALLHHGTTHPDWGEVLTRIGNRTLVQIRMHPDAPLAIFNKVFAGGDTERIFFDEAVWLPQEPNPSCPECGGTGDLRKAYHTFADTRVMPEYPEEK